MFVSLKFTYILRVQLQIKGNGNRNFFVVEINLMDSKSIENDKYVEIKETIIIQLNKCFYIQDFSEGQNEYINIQRVD